MPAHGYPEFFLPSLQGQKHSTVIASLCGTGQVMTHMKTFMKVKIPIK